MRQVNCYLVSSAPALFEPYANSSYPAVDEWTLSYNLMNETSQGGLKGVMTNHYETFIVGVSYTHCVVDTHLRLDRTRLRRDCRCWPQPCPHPHWLLGH